MPVDKALIGTEFPSFSVLVERGRLKMFAKATGQADAIYHDVSAATAAGHRDLPYRPFS